MYTMCVIDDMRHVVDSIVRHMNWEEHHIEIVGTATNGVAGLELIKEKKPDIVLTDIRMPMMDGLEMVSAAIAELPHVKIIIMSGYADFENAQKALRLGAMDFISKPVTPNELVRSVKKAIEQLDEQWSGSEQLQQMQKKVKDSLPVLRQDYFNLLIRHSSTTKSVKEKLGALGVELEAGPLQVMVVEIDQYEQISKDKPISEVEMIRFAAQNIVEETIRSFTTGLVFKDYQMSQLICILHLTPALDIAAVAEQCRDHVERFSKYTISIGIGSRIEQIEELPVSYQRALTALSCNKEAGGNSIVSFGDVAGTDSVIYQSLVFIREHLHAGLTVQECATYAHISPSYYANLFKKVMGMTFGQFVTQERIELAKKLLQTDMQIQEIATKVGFEDRPYFTELFKRNTGMTPSEYKQKTRL